MMRHTTEQIMTTAEDAHNTADDGEPRNENHREIQGQTQQHSKLINFLEVEQIYSCVNKMDFDTAYSKQ